MNFKNFLLLLIVTVIVLGMIRVLPYFFGKRAAAEYPCGRDEESCKDLNDSCRCFCAFKPGLRDKVADDNPVYIKNDPARIYCYCKPRDLKKYREDHKQG